MATYIRFVNEGEVTANEEIAEMVKLGLIIPSGRWPTEYEVLESEGLSWELGAKYDYDIIHRV